MKALKQCKVAPPARVIDDPSQLRNAIQRPTGRLARSGANLPSRGICSDLGQLPITSAESQLDLGTKCFVIQFAR